MLFKGKFGIMTFVLAGLFPHSGVFAADKESLIKNFIHLINGKYEDFPASEYTISEKGGIRKMEIKRIPGTESELRFTTVIFDKKNWYLGLDESWESSGMKAKVGMYFKTDKTPIVAISIQKFRFGPDSFDSEISFEEFPCDITKGAQCTSKNVTKEIFPISGAVYFAKEDAPSRAALAEGWPGASGVDVLYAVPQFGTTIVAKLVIMGRRSDDGDKTVNKIFRHTECSVNWAKKKDKFEVGKCIKNLKAIEYHGN